MPAPFPPAIGLIETFAVKGMSTADEVTMTSLAGLAERCSVRILLVDDDVPMSLVAPIRRSGRLILNSVPSRLLTSS